jgi:hypothetical protein
VTVGRKKLEHFKRTCRAPQMIPAAAGQRRRAVLIGSFRNLSRAEASGERTRPRVKFPASRGKTLFGETPNSTRGDAYAPRTYRKPWPQCRFRKSSLRIALGIRHAPSPSAGSAIHPFEQVNLQLSRAYSALSPTRSILLGRLPGGHRAANDSATLALNSPFIVPELPSV